MRVSRRSVVIQVDEFLQLTFHRAHVREMRTNRVSKFGSDPNAIAFIYNPDADKSELPKPEEVDAKKFKIPSPVIVNRADSKPKATWVGESDGKMIGVDGKPLADHKIYAVDFKYFAE